MANYGITKTSTGGARAKKPDATASLSGTDPYATGYQPSQDAVASLSGGGGYGNTSVFGGAQTPSTPPYGGSDNQVIKPPIQDPYAATGSNDPYASVINNLQFSRGMINSDGSVAPTSAWATPPQMAEINNPFGTSLSQEEIEYYKGNPEEWQMKIAAQPWLQAGVNTAMEMDDRGYTRFQDNRNYQTGRIDADRGYGLDVNQQLMNAIQNGLYYGLDERGVAIDEGRLGLEQLTGDRDYEMAQGDLALRQLTGDRDHEINQRLAVVKEQQVQINENLARVEDAYKRGIISNDQAEIARKALRDQWEQTVAQGSLDIRGQELSSLDAWRGTQAELTREEMENAYRTAVMNAVGRNQAQNVRWLRG